MGGTLTKLIKISDKLCVLLIALFTGFAAFFATYLVHRRIPFPFMNFILVSILIWGLLFYLAFQYFKKVHGEILSIKQLRVSLILAGLLTLAVSVYSAEFYLYNYRSSDVMIEALPQSDGRSTGSVVAVARVVTDHNLWRVEPSSDLFQVGLEEGDAARVLKFDYAATITLGFQRSPFAGVVRIYDGSSEVVENLYSPTDKEIFYYEVQSNRWIAWQSPFTYLRGLLVIGLLYIVIFAVIKLIIVEYRHKKSFFYVSMVIVFLLSISYYSHYDGLILHADSVGYVNYFTGSERIKGNVFVYPVFIETCKALFGPAHYLYGVIFLQALLSFVAAAVFYKILSLLIPYSALCAVGTVLYAANPAVLTWNLCYLTESLSLTGAVLCLYCIVKFIERPSRGSLFASIGVALILVFLRPTFLLLLGLLLGFFIGRLVFNTETQKLNVWGCVTALAAFAVVGVYGLLFSQQYGYFSISNALPRQQMYVCINEGFYLKSGDPVFIEQVNNALKRQKEPWDVAVDVLSNYSDKDALELTKTCLKNAGLSYWKYIWRIMGENAVNPFPMYTFAGISKPFIYQRLLNIVYYGHIYFLIMLEVVVAAIIWVRRKQPHWIHLGLCAYMLLIVVASFTATNSEFMRTGSSVLPFAYCVIFLSLSAIGIYVSANHAVSDTSDDAPAQNDNVAFNSGIASGVERPNNKESGD